MKFDVFLSHNSKDKAQIEWLAEQLEKRGLRSFLDKWDLQPGQSWRIDLEEALGDSKTAVVFFGPHGLGPWHDAEIDILVDRATVRRNDFRVTSILLPDATLDNIPLFLRRLGRLDFSQQWEHPSHVDEFVSFVNGTPYRDGLAALQDDPTPYRGLERFEAEHADFFFGRDVEVRELAQRLRQRPFVAVIGSSGCGKSSLVRAGLQRASAREEQGDMNLWPVIAVVPGSDPFRALADAIRIRADDLSLPRDPRDPVEWADKQVERLKSRPDGVRTLMLSLFGNSSHPTVLLIDQFEELFTHSQEARERADQRQLHTEAFIGALVSCVEAKGAPLRILITLRADFVDRCLQYPDLNKLLQDNMLLLGEPSDDALRELIKLPAAQRGAFLETGLVELILQDFRNQSGSLPLLEHVMLTLWKKRSGRWLTLDEYQDSEGLRGALNRHANRAMNDLPSDYHRRLARQLFIYRLITLGEGVPDTRRRLHRAELCPEGADRSVCDEVLAHLSGKDARLIVMHCDRKGIPIVESENDGETQVEITHEALLHGWTELGEWLTEARDRVRQHRRLSDAAAEWSAKSRPTDTPAYLLTGGRLEDAEDLAKSGDIPFNANEFEFLAASSRVEKRRQAEKERQNRIFKNLSFGLAVAFTIALAAGTWGWVSRSWALNAEWNAKHQLAMNHLDGAAVEIERGNLATGIFRYWQAYDAAPKDDQLKLSARSLLASWSSHRGMPLIHDGDVVDVAFSPDGQTVLTGSEDKTARLWDAKTGRAKGAPLQHQHKVKSVAFSPDGLTVLTVSGETTVRLLDAKTGQGKALPLQSDYTVRLWDAKTGQAKAAPLQHQSFVTSVAFSPDGLTVLTGSDDNTARLWDAKTGQAKASPLQHKGGVLSVAFCPDGLTVLTGSEDKTAQLWVATTGQPIAAPFQHQGEVRSVAFSPDGLTVLTGTKDGTAHLWDAKTRQAKGAILQHQAGVLFATFSPDGLTVLTGSEDKTARLWDAETGQAKTTPLQHQGVVTSMAISPDGLTVLTGSWDKTARLWDAKTGQAKGAPFQHQGEVTSVAFNPDGLTVLTGSHDKTARLWDAKTGQPKATPFQHQGVVTSMAISPDGLTVLTGSNDSKAHLWDAKTGQAKTTPLQHRALVWSVAFSPDGLTVLTGSEDTTARLWDAKTGQAKTTPLPHQARVRSVAFSPDGLTVFTGIVNSTARLWDAKTGQAKTTVLQLQNSASPLAVSPDGLTVLTGSGDWTARLWDAKTGQAKATPLQHQGFVESVAFSPDGLTVLTGSYDGTARLWDAKTGQAKAMPFQHQGGVYSVAFSPDGQTVLTGGGDRNARLWDVRTGQAKGPPLMHQGTVGQVAFGPDGQVVLTGSENTVLLWNVVPPAADEPERLRLSVEVRTGFYLDANGTRAQLTQEQWLDRRDHLDKLGGFCDVRSWDKLTDKEKSDLRTPPNKR